MVILAISLNKTLMVFKKRKAVPKLVLVPLSVLSFGRLIIRLILDK